MRPTTPHFEHAREVLVPLVAHVPVAVQRGVVHQDVDPPERVDRLPCTRIGGRGIRDVAVHVPHRTERRQLRRGRDPACVVDVGEHHGGSLAQEALRVGAPDAPAPARDDGDAVLEAHGGLPGLTGQRGSAV